MANLCERCWETITGFQVANLSFGPGYKIYLCEHCLRKCLECVGLDFDEDFELDDGMSHGFDTVYRLKDRMEITDD